MTPPSRRHLTASDHALVGLRSLPHFERIAKEKQSEAGKTHGFGSGARETQLHKIVDEAVSSEVDPQQESEPEPKRKKSAPQALDMAAEATGANRQYIADAKRLREEAPEIFAKVEKREVTIPQAKRLAKPCQTLNTGEHEWYTPAEIIEKARSAMGGIDLDPASSAEANAVVKARRFLTAEEDGLSADWSGRVWLNPPYSAKLLDAFARKLADSIGTGAVTEAVALVNNATETEWFHFLWSRCAAMVLVLNRIRFWRTDGRESRPLQGQVLFYFGERKESFSEFFLNMGILIERDRQ